MLTSDPRIVTNTIPVTHLTFDEATELAFFGAQVRHDDVQTRDYELHTVSCIGLQHAGLQHVAAAVLCLGGQGCSMVNPAVWSVPCKLDRLSSDVVSCSSLCCLLSPTAC